MSKMCDHTSVGMFIWKENKLLLIERGREPFGYAVPAGHVDDDTTFEAAAIRELEEETGLQTESIELLAEGRKNNSCRREGGSWHYWKLYTIISKGEINPSKIETKRIGWYSVDEIKNFAIRTDNFLKGKISDSLWEEAPGLEPVMYEWFKELGIL
jgi:ADP-ribose pyrophosphatase YjhB (NUDIX family)